MDRSVRSEGRGRAAARTVIACAGVWWFVQAAVSRAELVDPTRPPDYQPAGVQAGSQQAGALNQSPWNLTSTLVSPHRKVAVLNGRIVTRGSRIGDMVVVRIVNGEVVLRGGGRREVVTLLGKVIKKPVGKGAR